jgi:hypothetical protein
MIRHYLQKEERIVAWWPNRDGDIQTLAHALIEEHSSNGGHFSSPDTELMLRGICNFDETIIEALNRLANIKTKEQ